MQTAHKMKDRPSVRPCTCFIPFFKFSIITCCHFLKQRITGVQAYLCIVFMNKRIQFILNGISQRVIYNFKWLGCHNFQAFGAPVIKKFKYFLVLYITLPAVSCFTYKIFYKKIAILFQSVCYFRCGFYHKLLK